MGFYLRKSFSMGPVRLNLSKSGLGVSAGVRGARLGVTSQGRSYVHAGRYGLYMRQQLGSASRQTPSRARPEPIALSQETDATFPAPATRPVQRLSLPTHAERSRSPVLLVIAALVLGAFSFLGDQLLLVIGLIASVGLLVGAAYIWWRSWSHRRSRQRLAEALAQVVHSRRLDPATHEQLRSLTREVEGEDRVRLVQEAYLVAAIHVVDDGRVEDEELAFLKQVEELALLSPQFVDAALLDAWRSAYLAAVADHVLTAEEEASLEHIRDRLAIDPAKLRTETAMLERLTEIRSIREGSLPVVTPSKPLQPTETCHFEGRGRLLKEKQLRSFQQDGQRYTVRGLVVAKEGTLFITNKRVLLVHEGTSVVRIDRILDLEVDLDQNLLRLTKDDAKTPTLLTTPDAARAGAIIAAVAAL